jgi:hypothetical protein
MIYLLSGNENSGKEEVSKILVDDFGLKHIKYSDRVDELVVFLLNEMGGQIDNRKLEVSDCKGKNVCKQVYLPHTNMDRPLWYHIQIFKEDYIRKYISLNYWIEYVINQVKELYVDTDILVSDCIYPSELLMPLESIGGKYIKTVYVAGKESLKDHKENVEYSQKYPENAFDYIIVNNGNLEDLQENILAMLN